MLATQPWRLPAATLLTLAVLQLGTPVLAQQPPTPPQLAQQSAELEEAKRLNQQGIHFHDQGKYAEAEPFYQRALAIREKVLGPNHPSVATSLNNLALLYYDRGNYAEAEPLYQRALTIREKVLGPNHPDVAISLNNLARLYHDRGNYGETKTLLQRQNGVVRATPLMCCGTRGILNGSIWGKRQRLTPWWPTLLLPYADQTCRSLKLRRQRGSWIRLSLHRFSRCWAMLVTCCSRLIANSTGFPLLLWWTDRDDIGSRLTR